ncbi:MAG: hypothetical protein QOI80_16 [Solirubrobacteraceae bacterium]|nr:hypothetical protein [Solirubrobacteraceae bacterium]
MRILLATVTAFVALAVPASAQGPFGPLNDIGALSQGEGQTPDMVPVQTNAEPPFAATPRARCRPGDKTEPDIQGRVPAGTADEGFACNVDLVSHQGSGGGFKVLRYIDTTGRECAYYDTALLFPLNAFRFDVDSAGVAVLDMSDPAHPVQTDQLTEPPMLSPHESVVLNPKRGLIAAVLGNPATYPGMVSIYDASKDCRHPVHTFTGVLARYGHESGFAPDGKTFYATGTATKSITAIDVTDPKAPHVLWQGNVVSHGMSVSDDGNRAYVADVGGNMAILDTSEIQARKENPQVKEISRLTWTNASIPQNAIPFTRNGHPYVLEFDEYTAGTTSGGDGDAVGAAHIIDIGDETQPRVIANLRLQVNQPEDHAAAANDPGAFSPVQGYAAHYCNVPTRVNPTVVACSFIASGLRVFDISKLTEPKEIAYFVAPTTSKVENGAQPSDYAMSQPAIVPKRHEIWYSDGTTGFYAVRVAGAVWPKARAAKRCGARIRVRLPRGAKVRSVRARLGGRGVKTHRRGRVIRARAKRPHAGQRLRIRVTLRSGRVIRKRRAVRCG